MIGKAKKREWRFNYEADDKERRKLQLSVWEITLRVSSTIEMGRKEVIQLFNVTKVLQTCFLQKKNRAIEKILLSSEFQDNTK